MKQSNPPSIQFLNQTIQIVHLHMKIRNLLFAAAMFPWLISCAQSQKSTINSGNHTFTTAFYNVENLFDTKDDPKINDDEFTPKGKVPWTDERLETKIKHIRQVLTDIDSPAMPDLIGFAEVENQQVLEMLVSPEGISKIKYGIVHYDSPDERGIDVAMIYNPATFKVISSEPLLVVLPNKGLFIIKNVPLRQNHANKVSLS